jgi:hypothetical protein
MGYALEFCALLPLGTHTDCSGVHSHGERQTHQRDVQCVLEDVMDRKVSLEEAQAGMYDWGKGLG